jgi:hypothetical protein
VNRKPIALLLGALVLAGCSGTAASQASSAPTAAPTSEANTITGTVMLPGVTYPVDVFKTNGTCYHFGDNEPYAGVDTGTGIVIRDENNKTIGSAALPRGDADPERPEPTLLVRLHGHVPKAAFYHIAIGRRDGPTESYESMVSRSWKWDLSLGA